MHIRTNRFVVHLAPTHSEPATLLGAAQTQRLCVGDEPGVQHSRHMLNSAIDVDKGELRVS
jgi:hypothetical protein